MSNNEGESSVRVDLLVENHNGKYELVIQLRNGTQEILKIHRANLHRSSLTLVFAKADGWGEVIKETHYPDNPPIGTYTIKPGEMIERRISLTNRFPELGKILQNTTLIVFWSFVLNPIDYFESIRFGGYQELSMKP